MLRSDTFWGYEKEAPLLKLNRGYLQSERESLFSRVDSWVALAGLSNSDNVVFVEVENPGLKRIIVADAERTFRHDDNRARFVKLLSHVAAKFGDYAQGMSYVASFLSLTIPEKEVVALLTEINNNEKYLPGYWKAEAVKFATDAYVFQELAIKFEPKVANHLRANGVDPSSYCQKWFVGLCVHVLPFKHLFRFFEGFLNGGYKFLMQFGLSLFHELEQQLLAVDKNHAVFFGLLRLDPAFIPHDDKFDILVNSIFEGTKNYNLDGTNFSQLRAETYDRYLRARMESATNHQAAKDSDDEIEDCPLCNDDLPEVYCKECKIKICENCHNNPPAGSSHLRAHKVKPLDDSDEEEEESEDDGDDEEEKEKGGKKSDVVDNMTAGLEKLNV